MELTGRTLGHYRVHEELSRGGMGVVYRATDVRLNRDVALKVLPDELTTDADRRRRFLQEAQAASALEHPYIAVIYEADEVDGRAFIAMEYIRGEKLSEALQRHRPPVARVLDWGAEIAAGLARAHEKGIVHRDLKPANVMITDEGHTKIIDFGIAKLIEVAAEAGPTRTSHDTGPGIVVGTATYMSPEQARGETVDHRSDIFSIGIVLHEMLAGQPPFRGKSGIETASAILNDPAPRLPPLGSAIVAEASADIQRIVDKCLEKDPADRYQGMKDLGVDLRAARRRLETGAHPALGDLRPATLRRAAVATVAIATIGASALFWSNQQPPSDVSPEPSSKPSVAVLYFDNTTGDRDLDWMRTGITEMVVTDLSQSGEIEVVGTDRLYGVLAELNRQDDRVLSPQVISQVAGRIGVDRVVIGSYIKSGDALRINVRLQDARTGRIESSERVEGANTAALFAMVDDLSRRIRSKFETVRAGAALIVKPGQRPPDESLDRGVRDVTTSSIDAYRYYAEGINLHDRYREPAAAAMFEKAIAIDPSFAMAYAKLAVVQNNLGRFDLRDKFAAQALKLSDRLTPRERYYIEGFSYSNRRATQAQSIEAYRRCVAFDPGHQSCRHNLGLEYLILERFQDSIEQYEELVKRGTTNPTSIDNLVAGRRALGDLDSGVRIAEEFLQRNPDSAAGHATLGNAFIALGRYTEAMHQYARAAALDPTDALIPFQHAIAQLLNDELAAANATARALYSSNDQTRQWYGAQVHAVVSLTQGRRGEALKWWDRAARAYAVPGQRSGVAHTGAAVAWLAAGRTGDAVKAAARAVADARGTVGEWRALIIHAWSLAEDHRSGEAKAVLDTIGAINEPLAAKRDARNLALARGLVALAGGEHDSAVSMLSEAEASLPPRVANIPAPSTHVMIWSSLGRAHLAAGRPRDALRWFQKVADSGHERWREPIEFVRSFYFLGQIYEQQGDTARAYAAYRRFVGYWKDGDLDRDRIAEAQRKIAS